jgi:hypothetical protein
MRSMLPIRRGPFGRNLGGQRADYERDVRAWLRRGAGPLVDWSGIQAAIDPSIQPFGILGPEVAIGGSF